MMELIILLIFAVVFFLYFYYWFKAFLISAPYYPTNKKVIKAVLEELKNHDVKHIVELGAGDGRVVIALAKNGYEVTGIEINPILALIIYLRKILGGYKKVHVVRGNFLDQDFGKYDCAFIYLYPKVMDKLADKLYNQMPPGSVIFSNTFVFHDKKPAKAYNEHKLLIYKID